MRSKKRQKGDNFSTKRLISVKIAILTPHIILVTVTCNSVLLVNVQLIWFAETCKLTLFTLLKIFISLKNGSLLQAVWVRSFVYSLHYHFKNHPPIKLHRRLKENSLHHLVPDCLSKYHLVLHERDPAKCREFLY